MKRLILFLALLLLALPHLWAQVKAEVVLNQEYFLVGEELPAAVRITNRSGQPLQFGGQPDWLTFSVESRDGFIVVKTGEVPVEGSFQLESSKVATRWVNLMPHFALSRIGRYQIVATVRVAEWGTAVATPPKAFEIIRGTRIWSQEFGVPATAVPAGQAPEVRRYSLEHAASLRSQLRLYVRLTDADESDVIKVFPIGPFLSFSNPERQIDREGRLHVLYQSGARAYIYTVVNHDGEVVIRQIHDIVGTRPRLQLNEEAKVVVVGGARRATSADVPPVESVETNESKGNR
jgi:hypothetical protein